MFFLGGAILIVTDLAWCLTGVSITTVTEWNVQLKKKPADFAELAKTVFNSVSKKYV